MANPEPKVVVAPEYSRPLVPTLSVPTESEGKKREEEKVEEAVEKRPPVKPRVVEVEAP